MSVSVIDATSTGSTGTVMVSGNMPAFSAYLNSGNQSISATTWTKAALNAKEYDTASAFDNTTNYRFTPQVAGYYLLSAFSFINGSANPTYTRASIWKNGSEYKSTFLYGNGNTNGVATITTLVYLNGSTDYIEMYLYISGGSSVYASNGATNTYMSGVLVRAA